MKFDSYHPMINLIYFTAAIGLVLLFDHPVYTAIGYVCAFAYSVKLNGKRGLIFDTCLLPAVAAYAWWYSYYNHFGMTVLGHNFTGNSITLESVVFGLERGFTIATVVMIFSCVFAVFSSDKVVYLFGRISPRLSLFLSILLRTVPRVKKQAGRINAAQKGIGRAPSQGRLYERLINSVRLVSAVITWTLESFLETSQSMKCRGYSLKGRTAFSIYRFDNRDRSFVVVVFFLLTLTACAYAFDQTNVYYDPVIIMNPMTFMSVIFYAAYGGFMLLPLILQTAGEIRYEKQRAEIL